MNGKVYVDEVLVEATTGQMLITFKSGGDDFRFHLSPHVAVLLRDKIMRDGWQVLCSPDAEVVPFPRKRAKRAKK